MPDLMKAKTGLLNEKVLNSNEDYHEVKHKPDRLKNEYALKDSKIVIFSGLTGGCGCSFIVNSIAAYVALKKNKNILLLDMQTGKKDSRMIFNISGDLVRDLGDIRCDFSEIDLSVLKKLIINLNSSLNIILPSLKFGKSEISKKDNLDNLLENLSNYFDLILVDYPYYLFLNGESTLIDKIDKLVFVSQADYLSVCNLENFIVNLSCETASLKFGVVINKFNLKTVISPARIINTVKFPVKTFIPYDKDIDYLYKTRGPFAVFDYSLRTVRALIDLAEMFYEELCI